MGPDLIPRVRSSILQECARSDILALTEVTKALPVITSKLIQRFSSREGYELYADTLSTCMSYFLIIAEGKPK